MPHAVTRPADGQTCRPRRPAGARGPASNSPSGSARRAEHVQSSHARQRGCWSTSPPAERLTDRQRGGSDARDRPEVAAEPGTTSHRAAHRAGRDDPIRWLSRRNTSGATAGSLPSPEAVSTTASRRRGGTGEQPAPARLLSERGRRRLEPAGGCVAAWHAATTYAEQLDERTRGRLAMAVEKHVPTLISGSAPDRT
jgi:hypothetical protein